MIRLVIFVSSLFSFVQAFLPPTCFGKSIFSHGNTKIGNPFTHKDEIMSN